MAGVRVTMRRRPSKKWNSVSNLLELGPYAKPPDEKKVKKNTLSTSTIKKRFSFKKCTEREAKLRVQLFQAASMGNVSVVESLLDGKLIDCNVADYDDVTALHRAAKYCQVEVLLALLSRGADPNSTDIKNGLTPLHWLIIHSDPRYHSKEFEQCLVALVASGADLNKGDFNNVTPLHTAVGLQYKQCVRLLIVLGANPLYRDVLGRSPMTIASMDTYRYMKSILDKESESLHRRSSMLKKKKAIKTVDVW